MQPAAVPLPFHVLCCWHLEHCLRCGVLTPLALQCARLRKFLTSRQDLCVLGSP